MARFRFTDNSQEVIRAIEESAKNALKEIGLYVEGQAKLLTPVDTGNLRGSISHKIASEKEVHIGTDVEYAVYVEKGTSRQKAQPYLTPAVENNLVEIARIIQKHFKQVGGR